MRVRVQDGRLSAISRQLLERIERLREGLGIDPPLWCEILDVSTADYVRILEGTQPLSLLSLEALASYLDLSLDLILAGQLDYAALCARIRGDAAALPERYMQGAFSKRRTSINLLAYVEHAFGWPAVKRVLRRLQVHEAAFANPDELISLRFLEETCALLKEMGVDSQGFREMGSYSVVTNRDGSLGQLMAQAGSQRDLYSIMIEDASSRFYDTNFTYSLGRLSDEGCVIAARPTAEACDALGTRLPGSPEICLSKQGVFSSAAGYIGIPNLRVTEPRCIHRGDARCEYHVEFVPAQPERRKLSRSPVS
jgi:hypothetical protein